MMMTGRSERGERGGGGDRGMIQLCSFQGIFGFVGLWVLERGFRAGRLR